MNWLTIFLILILVFNIFYQSRINEKFVTMKGIRKKKNKLKKKIKEALSNQVDNITNKLGTIKRKYL